MDDKQQIRKPKFVQNDMYCPTYSPRKKLGIFTKMPKIVCNIKMRAGSLFCKSVQNSRKTFSDKWGQLSTSGNMLCKFHLFCALPLFLDYLQQKSNRKWVTYCPDFYPGDPRGNSYFFRKLCVNIKYQGK